MKLIYKSQGFPITIDKYIPSSFNYDQWVISDGYTKVAIGNEYRILVSTLADIQDHNDLTLLAVQKPIYGAGQKKRAAR